MKQKIKDQWVTALRSDYQQAKYGMRQDTANGICYCATGVLADLYAREYNVQWEKSNIPSFYTLQELLSFPPDSVIEWAGIDHGDVRDIMFLNDEGNSFSDIADYIEEHIKGE